MRILAMVAVIVMAAACGGASEPDAGASITVPDAGPTEGARCTGDLVCNGNASALFCEEKYGSSTGTFRAYACPSGCFTGGGQVLCRTEGVTDGMKCPEVARGTATCNADGGATKCELDGGWKLYACRQPCAVQSGQVFCSQ